MDPPLVGRKFELGFNVSWAAGEGRDLGVPIPGVANWL